MRILRIYGFFLVGPAIIFSALFTPNIAEAVPAFARQVGMPCMGCHFQNYPALNSFGRMFRAKGFTMQGAPPLIEGEDFSMPSTLNASVITKIRYQLKDDDDDNRGEVQWPDEAALLVGGRAAEKIGFLMELGLGPQDVEVDTATGEGEATGNFLSTKVHFSIGDSFAVIPFSTDGLGVGYGFELLNTGAQRSQRPIENRKGFSAAQLLGTASGEATGIAFVYESPEWFVNYSHWTPRWGNTHTNILGGMANYLRVAYMPNIGGWDTGFGASVISGNIEEGKTDPPDEVFVDGWGIDVQTQGLAGSMPLGFYLSYGVTPKSSATESNFFNGSTTDDNTAYGLTAKLGVASRTSIFIAHSSIEKLGESTASSTLGAQYMAAQNVKLELYTVDSDSGDPKDNYTMFMLFAGF